MAEKKTVTQPSQSILDRILGSNESDPELDKKIALARQNLTRDMPNEMKAANIQPTGILGRMKDRLVTAVTGGTPNATTDPFGNITYNPKLLSPMSQPEIEDILAHELTHVGQYQRQPMWKNLVGSVLPERNEGLPAETAKAFRMEGWSDPEKYRGRASEMEAFSTEQQRQLARGQGFPGYDIQLFADKNKKNNKINIGPSSGQLAKLAR